MRQSIAAVAVIRRRDSGRTLWLAQWNRNWQCYSFVGGHKRSTESFRECVVREVGEELGLAEGSEFRILSVPIAHVEYTAWSGSAEQETEYTMELFDVQLVSNSACQKIDADPRNRWLSEAELRGQRCGDGRPVSETIASLLVKAKLLGPNGL